MQGVGLVQFPEPSWTVAKPLWGASKWGWSWPCNDRDLWIIVKSVKKGL
jgi:hypothetical protein